MTFKIVATVVTVIVAAAANCGCSTAPSWVQAQNTYDAVGRVAPGSVPYAASVANGYGPAVDLGACARSPAPPTRIDQLCNRQDGNPF
jgi:hypothetical protein